MKTIYLLFVIFTDAQGYESMHAVSNIKHQDRLSCMAEKAQVDYNLRKSTVGQTHKDVKGSDGFNDVEFFCGEAHLYFNKQQKLY